MKIKLSQKFKDYYLKPVFNRVQLRLFGVSMLSAGLVVGVYLGISEWIPNLFAATSPWTQTDWSGGDSPSLATGTVTTWTSLDGVEATASAGLVGLKATDGWSSDYAGWARRAPITVTNSEAEQTNYQVKVSVTYDADMQADFDDIRFTNSTGTALDYWIQSKTDSISATVWVEADTLVGAGETTLYMYYGNSGVSSASNGENTFILFDDFSDGSVADWTSASINGSLVSFSVVNGKARVDVNSDWYAFWKTAPGMITDYEQVYKVTASVFDTSHNLLASGGRINSGANLYLIGRWSNNHYLYKRVSNGWTMLTSNAASANEVGIEYYYKV